MSRTSALSWVVLASLVSAASIAAEPAASLKRIGILNPDSQFDPQLETFRKALDGLGYVEGKNVAYDYRFAGAAEIETAAQNMVRSGVDLIFAVGTPPALAAKHATSTVPVVFISADPLGTGLIASLGRPGGNATGVSSLSPELGTKRLELLRELLPRAKRLAVLVNPDNPVSNIQQRSLEAAAQSLKFTLRILNVRRGEDLDGGLATVKRGQVDALLAVTDAMLLAHDERIAQHALKNRVPAIYAYRRFVAAGGLISYGADQDVMFEQCAALAAKILRGAKPADLPVEQPIRFRLLVNMKTARTLGLTVPQSILMRVDEVIR